MSTRSTRPILYTMILLCLRSLEVDAIVVSDHRQDYDVTPGEPSYGVNLDGVALLGWDSPDAVSIEDIFVRQCTGALITDRHILSAAHCFDEDHDGQVDSLIMRFPFVAAFELPQGDVLIRANTETIQMAPTWPTELTDIAVLELAQSAPLEVPRYPLNGRDNEIGKPVVLAGYGSTGFGDTGIDPNASEAFVKRAGRNRYEAFFDDERILLGFDFDSGRKAHNALGLIGEESDLGFAGDEVMTAKWDSGGPTFIGDRIAGVHSLNTWLVEADFNDRFDSSWGEVGFDARVSRFEEFICSATDNQAVFVPEPSAFCLIVTASTVVVLLFYGRTRLLETRCWTNEPKSRRCSRRNPSSSDRLPSKWWTVRPQW